MYLGWLSVSYPMPFEEATNMQINEIIPGATKPWIAPENCPHNERAFSGESLEWCEACGTVLNGGVCSTISGAHTAHDWTDDKGGVQHCPGRGGILPRTTLICGQCGKGNYLEEES